MATTDKTREARQTARQARRVPTAGADQYELTWPYFMYTIVLCFLLCTAVLWVWSMLMPAPLEPLADPNKTPAQTREMTTLLINSWTCRLTEPFTWLSPGQLHFRCRCDAHSMSGASRARRIGWSPGRGHNRLHRRSGRVPEADHRRPATNSMTRPATIPRRSSYLAALTAGLQDLWPGRVSGRTVLRTARSD